MQGQFSYQLPRTVCYLVCPIAVGCWGHKLKVIHCSAAHWQSDNTQYCSTSMSRDLWGGGLVIPLSKEILVVMNKYDVRLYPVYINTKLNIRADALSRCDWVRFAESVGLVKACARAYVGSNLSGSCFLSKIHWTDDMAPIWFLHLILRDHGYGDCITSEVQHGLPATLSPYSSKFSDCSTTILMFPMCIVQLWYLLVLIQLGEYALK